MKKKIKPTKKKMKKNRKYTRKKEEGMNIKTDEQER